MPPVPGYILATVFVVIPTTSIVPLSIFFNLSVGMLIGYVNYDLMHYFMHHSNPKDGSFLKTMKVYHMQHHYKYGSIGFGVSNKFWDVVFDSGITNDAEENRKKMM
jgi:4-hydroxysphinganine ceramide fatty acyl 2-hydroxylase